MAGDAVPDPDIVRKRFLRLPVPHRLDAEHEVAAPYVPDDGEIAEGLQALFEVGTGRANTTAEVLAFHEVDVCDGDRAGDSVAGVGESVGQQRPVGTARDGVEHRVGDQRRGQRHVARRNALGRHDHVRHHVEPILAGEEVAQAAECGHDFVRDVKDVVRFADLLHAPVIADGGDQHATGPHDGLGEEAGDVVRPELGNLAFELVDEEIAVGRLVVDSIRHPVAVGFRHVVHQTFWKLEAGLVARLARQRGGEVRAAVVGVPARDDETLRRLADGAVIEVRDPHRGVVGDRAAGAVEDVVQIAGRQLRELRRQLGRRRIADVGEVRIVREHAELPGRGIDQLLPAEADVGEPQAADPVDELLALGVPDVAAFPAHHDGGAAAGPLGEIRPWVDAVIEIGLPEGLRIVVPEGLHRFLPGGQAGTRVALHHFGLEWARRPACTTIRAHSTRSLAEVRPGHETDDRRLMQGGCRPSESLDAG